MIKTKVSGTTAIVTRTLELPKSGALGKRLISQEYKIETGLTSKDIKNEVGAAVLKKLPSVIDAAMNSLRAKYDNRNVTIWVDTGKTLLAGGFTKKDAEKVAKDAESKIASNWNEYSKKIAHEVKSSVEELTAREEEIAGQNVEKLKVKFSSEDLKPKRVAVLSFLLDTSLFLTGGPPSWIAGGISLAKSSMKGYHAAWKIAEKQSTEIRSSLNQIADGLEEANTALKKTRPYLKQLEHAQKKSAAQIIAARVRLEKMTGDLEVLEKRAASENAVREGRYLKELRIDTQTQFFKLIALEKTLNLQEDLQKATRDAAAAVDFATDKVEARREGFGKIMQSYSKNSKDADALLTTLLKVAKKIT
ncbi:MAG: hypothetical protein WA790_19095 [Sulfitobacter sp.]